MLYEVKTTSGYGFRLRGVNELKVSTAEQKLSAELASGKTVHLNGVTEVDAYEDPTPWMNSFEMVPPDGGDAAAPSSDGFEFKREEPVPAELATTTFCPLERLLEDRKVSFENAVVKSVQGAKRRGVLHA